MSKAAELARLIGDGTFGTGGADRQKIINLMAMPKTSI